MTNILSEQEESMSKKVTMFLAVSMGAVIYWLQVVRFEKDPDGQRYAQCKKNARMVAIALDDFLERKGVYPKNLEDLIADNLLESLPTCPAAGRMTFSNYQVRSDGKRFSFACVGRHHASFFVGFRGCNENIPAYTSEGLIGPSDRE